MKSNNKKTGILTFSFSSNPGSVLQAYALQETVSEIQGEPASIINYQKTGADRPILGQNVFFGPISKWTPRKCLKWTVRMVAYFFRMRKYRSFFEKYYNSDPQNKPCPKAELVGLADKYGAFIVGSDQVWNFDSINVDSSYFLDFVKGGSKKISYAASFGQKSVPETQKEEIARLVNDFDAISVREKEGVDIVKELTGKSAEWVLDPSLIFDEEKWNKMAVAPKEKDYVFLYLRESSASLEQFAKALADRYGLKVVKAFTHWKCNSKGKKQSALGPLEWLGYMKNARYVVTNSFHGICFSIAYQREFFVDVLKGARAFTSPRILGMLEQFDLNSRCVDEIDVSDITPIEYQKVKAIKDIRKEKSLQYLKDALKET